MQIRELVLYGYNGRKRTVKFNLGALNIICGKSESGKSAIGDIIDYCLGGNSCNIADGVIRENVAWYGLLLQFKNERVFVARKNPEPGQQSTSYCYVDIGEKIESPNEGNFLSNENVAGLEETLSHRLGITENMNIPPFGKTRLPLSANVRHSLYYCFQNQDEIAAKKFLFHRQSEDFVTQSIRDTLPYFLGIVNEDALELEQERALLKRKITNEERRVNEALLLQGGGLTRALSLITEAQEVGILNSSLVIDTSDFSTVFKYLCGIEKTFETHAVSNVGMSKLSNLQTLLSEKTSELDELSLEIDNARAFLGETSGYVNEVEHQKVRLESIGIFDQLDLNPLVCPFCSAELEKPLPTIEMMKKSIINLNQSIANVSRERPKLRKHIDTLVTQQQHIMEEIRDIKAEIDGIYSQQESARKLRDLNSRRARVIGRISLWLESINESNFSKLVETPLESYKQRLMELDKRLDSDSVEERKQSALSRISVDMSRWAKELDLESSENPYRLDMNKVTVVVDKADRPVPLMQLGSGSNWVGVHLITYFALHKYFINARRPVPRFLFLDQPSQVFFPSENDQNEIDWMKVTNLYQFINKRVAELNKQLQVIVVDHAELQDDTFKAAVLENWWGDINLVPVEWYK